MTDSGRPVSLVGLVRLRDHCTFSWQRIEGSEQKSLQVSDDHCLQCLAEARRLGYKLLTRDGKEHPV